MNILSTIIPVFIVIFIGWAARQKDFLSDTFITQANRLVYHLAIPAMVFISIAGTDLTAQINIYILIIAFFSLGICAAAAWLISRKIVTNRSSMGTFIQSSFHGNLGYIGFAVAYYYLGAQGLVKAAILAGFVMILQNILAVIILQYYSDGPGSSHTFFPTFKKAVANPVILSALAGILFSLLDLELWLIVQRALEILKGMALPLALLIIGASLSFNTLKPNAVKVIVTSCLKLVFMPALALICFAAFSIPKSDFLPALIILAAPSATLTYILAKEIGGDPDLAGTAISISTLLSGISYIMWLSLV